MNQTKEIVEKISDEIQAEKLQLNTEENEDVARSIITINEPESEVIDPETQLISDVTDVARSPALKQEPTSVNLVAVDVTEDASLIHDAAENENHGIVTVEILEQPSTTKTRKTCKRKVPSENPLPTERPKRTCTIRHETDIDAVTCYAKFNWGKWGFEDIIVNFAKTNYMDIELIAAMVPIQIHLYGQKEEALMNVEKMLIDAPNSLRLLYYRVFALCEQKVLSPKIVSAIDDFLKIAPDDHEKVPECIYRKAIYYSLNSNYELFSKYFLAAQEAEKKQLPCFLPYKCRDKSLAEKLYSNLIKGTMDNLPKLLPLTSSKQNLIIQHRKSFIDAESINSKKSAFLKPKQIPSKRPEFVTPKLISLREMGSAENSFYGRMLNAKVIDWPFLSKSNLFVVIKDDNGDVQRLAIRNWPLKGNNSKTRADAMKTLSPHCTILILYPQLQRMNDMDIMVSVESMLYIKTVNDEFNDKRCFVCGKATKVLKCSKCLLSHYCSKDCQKIDWIGLKHKDVCDLLKKYGEKIITS